MLASSFDFRAKELTKVSELFEESKAYCLQKFKETVYELGGNAAIGIDFETSMGGDVAKVSVSGTVVVIEKD